MLAENEGHEGHASAGGKGNTHLRVHLRPQRKDQRGHSSTGSRDRSGFASFHAKPKIGQDDDYSVTLAAKSHDQARDNPDDKGPRGSPSAIRA
jgi:hypothetical protein